MSLQGIEANLLAVIVGIVILSIVAGITFYIINAFENGGFTIPNEMKNVLNVLANFTQIAIIVVLAVMIITVIINVLR